MHGHHVVVLPGDWTDVATAIAAIVSAAAAVFTLGVIAYGAWVGLRQYQDTVTARAFSRMAELSKRWDEELLTDSRRLAATYGPKLAEYVPELQATNDSRFYVLERVPNFFEDLSVLEQHGAIPFSMIVESLGWTVVKTWDSWKPAIDSLKLDPEEPDRPYANFGKLAERMRAQFPARQKDKPSAEPG